jgi:anti-sigma B factor antagonist
MAFEINKNEVYTLVKIGVEKLDSNVAPSLKSELVVLNADGVKNILMDLSATRYCDSSGLSAILVGNRLCRSANGNFVLTGLQEPVKKLIAISQLDSILNIASDMKQGVIMVTTAEVNN